MPYKSFSQYFKEKWGRVDLITGMDYEDLLKIATRDYDLTEQQFKDVVYSYFSKCKVCGFLYNEKRGHFVEDYGVKMCAACVEMDELGELEMELVISAAKNKDHEEWT